MKFALETNVQTFVRSNRSILCRLAILVTLVLLFIGSAWLFGTFQPLVRDFYIANYAHVRAGDPIPFTDEVAGYSGGFRIDPGNIYAYGIESNSIWAADYVRLIVPYMTYEHLVNQAIYPAAANVVPFDNTNSFHVAGRMFPMENAVLLNERYFLDGKWDDQRRALETLTHELVHVQRGAFIMGSSAELESATSAATLEVLAAMCLYKDELACQAFWLDIEHLSRSSLLVQLNDYGVQGLYEAWANAFWRDDIEEGAYSKAMRFWDDSPGDLMEIREKYSLVPWMDVVFGVAYGIPLNTGNPICVLDDAYMSYWASPTYTCTVIGMPFDDSWYLMQDLMWILR